MNLFKNVDVLVGDKKLHFEILGPYNKKVINFLNDLSINLIKIKNIENYPDIGSAAFFCRKANIMSHKKNYLKFREFRIGLGLVFHISPSNAPINFLYTLVFGLITGNSNIIKIPSKEFEQINIICKSIKELLKKKHYQLKKFIKIVRYNKENEVFTNKISSVCDARIIWGGDKTINEIRNYHLKPRSLDLTFADRYSVCIINSQIFLKQNLNKKQNLINNFYNDTFTFDQNACSSPHLILWYGKKINKAKKIFWQLLENLSKKKYKFIESSAVDKYTQLCKKLMQDNNIKNFKIYGNTLSTIAIKKLNKEIINYRGRWGYFFEYNMKKLKELALLDSKKIQTLTYFGISLKPIKEIILKYNLFSFDRIVPIGQALDLDFKWDGYDINKSLTRVIDIK